MARQKPPRGGLPSRPQPPAGLIDTLFGMSFRPAPELRAWVDDNILREGAPLYNEDHLHLRDAQIGFLWASSGFVKRAQRVVGMAEVLNFNCHAWQKARQWQQMREWFGPDAEFLDFVITLDGHHCAQCSDADFCALIEHELYHCGHQKDEFGVPKFTRDGRPVFAMREHDVQEFVGVVRRYGVGHPDGALADLIRAAVSKDKVSEGRIADACGICMGKVSA
jgi:putative metallopeptidase